MISENLTQHAVVRMAQRGIRVDDLGLIRALGTEVEGGWLVRERDCTQFIMACKQLMDHADRLRGVRLVEQDGVVVTTYRARPRKQRKLLRRDVKHRVRREGE